MTVTFALNEAGSIGTSASPPVATTSSDVQHESINASLDLRNKKLMQIIQIELGIPTQTIRHRATRSAHNTQATLPDCCLVQKGLTGKSGDKIVLWKGISDFRVSRSHTPQVAKALTQTGRAAANHTLNPQEIKPADFVGAADRMVSRIVCLLRPR